MRLTWNIKAYRLRECVIQSGFGYQLCSAYHPKVSSIHPPKGPPIPAPSPNMLPKIHQPAEEDKVIRLTCSPFLGITPAAFLDGSLACRKPVIRQEHTMVPSLSRLRSKLRDHWLISAKSISRINAAITCHDPENGLQVNVPCNVSKKAGTNPPPPMPATALAAMSASIEEASPQPMVPVPFGPIRRLSFIQNYIRDLDEPNNVKPKSIAPRRPRISESRPTQRTIYPDSDQSDDVGARTI